MNVDIHQHTVPKAFLEAVRTQPEALRATFAEDTVTLANGARYKLGAGLLDLRQRLRDMDEARIDVGVLSVPPWLFGYDLPPEAARQTCSLANDGIAAAVRAYPDRFAAMGHAPLQDVDASIVELEKRRFPAVQIGSHVNGRNLDDSGLLPFFQAAERLGTFVFVHPPSGNILGADRLKSYYLSNLLGNVIDTATAVASVMFGGVLDVCPGLKIGFAHGGGAAPFIWGRWAHGQRVRAEAVVRTRTPILEIPRRIYFDTITHSPSALRWLIGEVGADRVMLGTDAPFDMADMGQVGKIEDMGPAEAETRGVLGGTAAALLGL